MKVNCTLRWIAKWDDKFYRYEAVEYWIIFIPFFANISIFSLWVYCIGWDQSKVRKNGVSDARKKLKKKLISERFNDKDFYFIAFLFLFIATYFVQNLLQKESLKCVNNKIMHSCRRNAVSLLKTTFLFKKNVKTNSFYLYSYFFCHYHERMKEL